MTGLLTLIGLGLNVIGSFVLIGSNRDLIKSIINSFRRIEDNMTIGKMGDDEWFPNGWEGDFVSIVKKTTNSNRFAFISLTIGFSLQFITTALNVL